MTTTLEIPEGAKFLKIEMQDDQFAAWFMVSPENKLVPRKFKIYGTGFKIPQGEKYLGTFQNPPFVWHLFVEDLE